MTSTAGILRLSFNLLYELDVVGVEWEVLVKAGHMKCQSCIYISFGIIQSSTHTSLHSASNIVLQTHSFQTTFSFMSSTSGRADVNT